MTIEQKIEAGYIPGCIKYKEQCGLYLMPIAYWILNYKKYDPTYNPNDWEFVFRNNILIVDHNTVEEFINTVKVDKIDAESLIEKGVENILIYIDFDGQLLVNSFNDIGIEEYLPNNNWEGKYDDAKKYLPPQCKLLI